MPPENNNPDPSSTDGGQQTDPPATGDPAALGDAGKRALDAERARAKAAEDRAKQLEARVKQFEDAGKSDLEKLTSDRDEARTRAEKAEAALLRLEVGHAKGLSPKQAARLVGSNKDELEADADELLAAFRDGGGSSSGGGDGTGATPPTGKPREQLPRGGGDPTGEPEVTDPAKLAELIPRR